MTEPSSFLARDVPALGRRFHRIHDRLRAGEIARSGPLDLLMVRYNAAHLEPAAVKPVTLEPQRGLVSERRGPSSGMPSVRPAALSLRACLMLSAVLPLWACPRNPPSDGSGSAGAGGTGGAASSANSDQRLDELSRSDLQSYCKDLNQELSTRFDNRRLAAYACTRMYLQQGDSSSCNQGLNDCLLGSPQASITAPRPADFQIDNDECAAIGACTLTLREFDACIGDRFDQSDQLIARVNCSLASDPASVNQLLQQIDSPRQVPQSCAGVLADCPGLL